MEQVQLQVHGYRRLHHAQLHPCSGVRPMKQVWSSGTLPVPQRHRRRPPDSGVSPRYCCCCCCCYLTGGGVVLLCASKDLNGSHIASFGQQAGVQIIQNALKALVHATALQSVVQRAVIVGMLLEQEDIDLGLI